MSAGRNDSPSNMLRGSSPSSPRLAGLTLSSQPGFRSASMWIAPVALGRLGAMLPLVERFLADLESADAGPVIGDLGWSWPGWVAVNLESKGFGIRVHFGPAGDGSSDPDAPVLRPLSVRSTALDRQIGDWIDAHAADVGVHGIDAQRRGRLIRALGQILSRHPRVRAAEIEGSAALAIPPAVLRLARVIDRCQPRARHRQLRARALDLAWRHFVPLRRAQAENPALFPLLGAFVMASGLRQQIDPVRQLNDWCRFRGLSKAEWAGLARNGTRAYQWALRLVGDRVSPLDLVIGLIRVERALGKRLGELDSDLRIRWLTHVEPWRMRPEIEHAIRLFARTQASLAEAPAILGLLHVGLDAGLVKSADMLAVRGWHALSDQLVRAVLQRTWRVEDDARRAAHFAINRIEQEMTASEWLRSLAVPAAELIARRLTDAAAIEAEGQQMFHCIANYTQAVARGRYLVYTIRGPANQPVATLGLIRRGPHKSSPAVWEIDQVRGIADRPAPESAQRMARLVLDACRSPAGPPEYFAAPPTIDGPDAWMGDEATGLDEV